MTITDDLLELMHAEIDGALLPQGQERLRRILVTNDEARRELERLRALSEALGRAEVPVPPADLRESILASLSKAGTRRAAGEPVRFRRVTAPSHAARRWLGYGYALAAGILIGAVGLPWVATEIAWPPGVAPDGGAGTMGLPPYGGNPTSIHELSLSGASGAVTLSHGPEGGSLVIDMNPGGSAGVRVVYDPAGVVLEGFTQQPGATTDLSAGRGIVSWTQAGGSRVTLRLSRWGEGSAVVSMSFTGPDGEGRSTEIDLAE